MQNERDIRECLRRGDVAGLFAKLGWAVDELALHGHVWRAWGW